jgi:cysteine desulfurase / selenocysteine lyase
LCKFSVYRQQVTESVRLGSRVLFPDLQALAYLNHAAISPLSSPVVAQVSKTLSDYAAYGVQAFLRWEQERQALKSNLASLIGATPDEIAFVLNTSRGVSEVALSIPWRRGDRVVLFGGEFPANITPWQRAAELFDLELRFIEANTFHSDEGLELLDRELQRGCRMVAVSLVQFQTGLRMPIRQIGTLCREYGAEVCVDAIQACGSIPVDVMGDQIDYLACGGHKWLLGVEGAAFVYVNQKHQPHLRPYTAGWLSHENAADFLFKGAGHLRTDRPLRRSQASVFEGGTQNLLGLSALGASVPLLLSLGVGNIFEHVCGYLDDLELGLVERGFKSLRAPKRSHQSCLLCVQAPTGHEELSVANALRGFGVLVGTPDGNLRFSPHFANHRNEVPLVLEAVDRALKV